jgi:hypothetical protein
LLLPTQRETRQGSQLRVHRLEQRAEQRRERLLELLLEQLPEILAIQLREQLRIQAKVELEIQVQTHVLMQVNTLFRILLPVLPDEQRDVLRRTQSRLRREAPVANCQYGIARLFDECGVLLGIG